jgi:hypothetical protein
MQRHKKLEFVPADDDSAHFEQAINVAKYSKRQLATRNVLEANSKFNTQDQADFENCIQLRARWAVRTRSEAGAFDRVVVFSPPHSCHSENAIKNKLCESFI